MFLLAPRSRQRVIVDVTPGPQPAEDDTGLQFAVQLVMPLTVAVSSAGI